MQVRQLLGRIPAHVRRPLLSVVIPCKDAEPFVEAAIRSVLNQSLRDLEVIVVEDGSNDASPTIVAALAAHDRRLRVVRGRQQGPGAARNDGVTRARGRYLAFVDADDRVLPGAYEDMVASLEQTGSAFAVGGYRRHGASGSHRPKIVARVHDRDRLMTRVGSFPDVLDEPVLWNRVFRADFWRSHVAPVPEDVNYEDQEPCLRAALAAPSFDVLARDVYSWRLADGRISRSQTKSQIQDLRDRVTVIRRMRGAVRSAEPGVRDRLTANWLGRDLVMYARFVPSATKDYVQILRSLAGELAADSGEGVWALIPFQDRLLAWVLASGSAEDLEEVLGSRLEDTMAVPILAHEDGSLEADATVLSRIAEVPLAIRVINEIDLTVVCSTERIAWLDSRTCRIFASAHIPGIDPADLDSPPVVELVGSDGVSDRATDGESGLATDADFLANDPWRSYEFSGLRATVRLRDVERQWIRVTLGIRARQVSALLPLPATTHFFRVGPLDPSGPHFVSHEGPDSSVEFRRCTRTPYRLVGADGSTNSIDFDIAADAPGPHDGAPPVTLVSSRERLQVEVSLRHGLLHGHIDLDPFGPDRQYIGERRYALVVEDGEDIPVMWDKSAHLARASAVRAFPREDGFAAVEHRARRVTVDHVELEDGFLLVSGRVSPEGWNPGIHLVSSMDTFAATTSGQSRGRWEAVFDLHSPALVSGGYFLRWSLPGDEDPRGWCRAGHAVRKGEQYHSGSVRSVRVSPKRGGAVGLTVGPPLSARERTRRGRQLLIESTPPPVTPGVVFETFGGKSSGDNPGAICRDLLAHGVDVPMWWSVVDGTIDVPEGTEAVVLGTRKWFDVVRSAKVLVTNNNFPQWFRKQDGQFILQTWHGTPIKRLLFDAPPRFIPLTYRRLMRRQVPQWDLLLAQTEQAARDLCSSTGYTGEVHVGEQPRNVGLLGGEERATEVRAQLGLAPAERVVLYAPTWREGMRGTDGQSALAGLLDPVALAESTGARILVRSHHMNHLHAVGPGVLDVSSYPNIEDLMLISDVLVTDYSSVIFDFALTGRPAVIYAPDLGWYRDVERGFYRDWPRRIPWPLATTQDEMCALVLQTPSTSHRRLDVESRHIEEDLRWIRNCILERVVVSEDAEVHEEIEGSKGDDHSRQ